MPEYILQSSLAAVEGLELVSPDKVAGLDGRKLGRRIGNALEFAEYKDYQSGDDIRRLDWRVYARTKQFMVRQYSEEVDPRCDIVLDHSASMACPEEKSGYALGLAVIFAKAALNAGFHISLWHAGCKWEKDSFPEDAMHWANREFRDALSPGETVHAFPVHFQRRGIRIVISDFLWQSSPQPFLHKLSEAARHVLLIRLDYMKLPDFTNSQNITLIDAENGHELEQRMDNETLKQMQERFNTHRTLWENAAAEHGADFVDLTREEIEKDWAITALLNKGILQ